MRLDGTRLRARRLQLGLTMRGLAREAQISQTLVKRLEDTGDIDSITCATLQRLVNALSMELGEILDQCERHRNPDEHVLERLGTILLGRQSGITVIALGRLLEIEAGQVEDQLKYLATQLRPFGICIHRGSTGVRLTAVETTYGPIGEPKHLEAPTRTDLRLVHRTLTCHLRTRDVAVMENGNVSLHRLINSGLVEIRTDGAIVPGPTARDALQLGCPR